MTTSKSRTNSLNPSTCDVSLYPRAFLHRGHGLVRASSPEYHLFMHSSHPIIALQHLVKINGGFIGNVWQILHMKASVKDCRKPMGIFIFEFTEIIPETSFCISVMLPFSSFKFSKSLFIDLNSLQTSIYLYPFVLNHIICHS